MHIELMGYQMKTHGARGQQRLRALLECYRGQAPDPTINDLNARAHTRAAVPT